MSADPFSPADFGGTVRLFPLPDLVLFPHVAQPLHVFEPRYRQLMADALGGDRLIAMALLRPGWEGEYHQSPAIHPVVCVGQIHQEERLPDGRYNLLLQGRIRARVSEELTTDRLYRVARAELMPDVAVSDPAAERELRHELGERVTPFFSAQPPALEQLRRLLAGEIALGHLCDLFCFALPLGSEAKQELLAEAQVEARVRLLLRRLEGVEAPAEEEPPRRGYPPSFSDN
jgi:Lon protease-like protein